MLRLFLLSMAVLWLILIAMLFWGCGEDNCSGQNIKDIIVGKWKLLTVEDLQFNVIYEFKANGQLFTSAISLYPVYLEGNLIHSEVVEESKYYIVDENTIIILGTVIAPRPPYDVRDVDLTCSFKYIEDRETIILALVENEADNFILERVK